MAANVNGPILGFVKSGIWLYSLGVRGALTSAEVMPHFGPAKENYLEVQKKQGYESEKEPMTRKEFQRMVTR